MNTDDILRMAEARFEACQTSENNNNSAARSDLQFLKGDQWPADAKRQRTIEKRPCLTINKLPSFVRQVVNDHRQNRPCIHVHPVDDKADPKVAEIFEGMSRYIEYSSKADVCYDTAIFYAASAGVGYFRLLTDYESPDSFDQTIKFDRISNIFSVHIDPSSRSPDGGDMRYCFIETTIPKKDFINQYPDSEIAKTAGITDDREVRDVLVLEYYSIEETPDKLVQFSDGTVQFKSELKNVVGLEIVRERDTLRKKVMWRKLAGGDTKAPGKPNPIRQSPRLEDLLEETEIPCDYIPVMRVVGSELDIDGEITYSGVIRDSKDSNMMYNFWMTSATEEVSMRPKTPYIGAEGQFAGHEEEWRQANVRTFSYLEYKPKTINGMLAPPPSRQPMADVPSGVLQMAMHVSDEIKAVTGIFDASLGARGNETSGIAISNRQRQGEISNFHYADNLNKAVKQAGLCLLSMIPRVFSGPRVVRILGKDDKMRPEKVNQPGPPKMMIDEEGNGLEFVQTVLNDLSAGKYDVTVSAGPGFSTLRDEAKTAMLELSGNWPKLMDVAGDEVVRSMDWPGAYKIADRIKRTIPPEIIGDEDGNAQQSLPPQVRQMMDQASQYIQELQQALQEAQSGIEAEKIKATTTLQKALMDNSTKFDVEELKGWIALQLQMLQPPAALTTDVNQDMQENDSAPSSGQTMGQAQ